jgi:hypothetical protein
LFLLESLAGIWIVWQATEDVIQASVGALAPIGFIIVLASVTAQFLIIPERKGQLLNTYRAHSSKWIFRNEDNDPPVALRALPTGRDPKPNDNTHYQEILP